MAIDIKELNKDYTKEKAVLARLNAPGGLKDKISQFENDIHQLRKEHSNKKLDFEYAEKKNDKTAMSKLKTDIEDIEKDIEELKRKLEKAKGVLESQKKKVDEKVEELSKDTETKKKLDAIIYKKYDRKRKKEENKKKQLETIKEVLDSHPAVKKWVTGIEGYNKQITKCNRIIRKLGTKSPLTPEETKELADANSDLVNAQSKLADRQMDLVNYFKAKYPDIDSEILKGLHSYSDIDRQSKGCDKTIANCNKAMNGLTVSQELKDFTNANYEPSLPIATSNKISFWRHPIKWMKSKVNSRKSSDEPSLVTTSNNEQRKAFKDELKLSKDEYSADVVQKYLENYEKGLHEAAKTNRGKENSR